ncbi:MAG: hypothetical protein ACO1OB_13985, partial [Archangium sp.]
MPIELLTPLPPGAESFTRLARQAHRCVVLREIKEGTDCSYPLGSPGLVTLQEVVELDGRRHALFPYAPGVTLRELLRALEAAGQTVTPGLMARIVIDAARSLQTMQPARAHGGISDASLQLGFDGSVALLDFGAPRVSRFRAVGRVNFSADVFALGAVLHAAFTGFEGEYATRLATLPAPSTSHPGVTTLVDAVVMKALSAEPDARHTNAGVFGDELTAAIGDELFTSQQVAALVLQFFSDRQRLLAELTQDDEVPLGDGSVERTEPRIVAPPPSEKELVPWDSRPSLPQVMVEDKAPSETADEDVPLEAGDGRTQPRLSVPPELLGPVPELNAPRATGEQAAPPGLTPRNTGQRAALAPRRSTGEFVLASSSDSFPDAKPRAAFDSIVSGDAGPIPITAPPRNTGERAAVSESAAPRKTGSHSSSPPRATGQRPALTDAETGAETSLHQKTLAPRSTGSREAIDDVNVETGVVPKPSAPPRKTGSQDLPVDANAQTGVASKPRKTGAHDVPVDLNADIGVVPRPSAPSRKSGAQAVPVDVNAETGVVPRPSAPPRKSGALAVPVDVNADTGVVPRPSAPPRKTGAREAIGDADTDPRPVRKTGLRDAVAESSPKKSDATTDPRPPPSAAVDPNAETGINPKPSALIRKTGQRDALGASPRKTGAREALGDITADSETNPRASAPVRKTGAREALGESVTDGETNPRASAPVRKTGARDVPRMTGQRAALEAPPLDENDPTTPRAKNPVVSRTANTADRLWAATQERVSTPPHGTP